MTSQYTFFNLHFKTLKKEKNTKKIFFLFIIINPYLVIDNIDDNIITLVFPP